MKKLLIVESPAKIKTISKFLGKDFKIMSTVGHIKDLPQKELGITLNGSLHLTYVPLENKDKVIADICKEARKADQIFLAPDPDREGEIIAFHVAQEIEKVIDTTAKIHRITFNEITKPAIESALEHPSQIDLHKVHAQQARRVLDRWVGYEVSPILWKKITKGLSAGRVQSVALKLICDRELEIRNFKPEEYWTLDGVFGYNKTQFTAALTHVNDKKVAIKNEQEATELKENVQAQKNYTIESVKDSKRLKNALPPFMTSTLQQAAYNKLGFSVQKTMQIAQQLYEGLPLQDPQAPVALITYMRTDSLRISEVALKQVRSFITQEYGKDYLPTKSLVYAKGKAQDAHEAIRPIDSAITPDQVAPYLDPAATKLYTLIWKRFIACQMKAAEYAQRQVVIQGGSYTFKVTGSTLMFDGFLKVYQDDEDEKEQKVVIPKDIAPEKSVIIKQVDTKQHFTQPPARYTEASLVKDLEKEGIGRPSTYATILKTIQARSYTTVDPKKRFVPTELGMAVTNMLTEYLPDIMNLKFTAQMEEKLDEIAHGSLDRDKLLRTFWDTFEKDVTHFKGETAQKKPEPTELNCTVCKKNKLAIRFGKTGSFLGCLGYPECTFTSNFERQEDGTIILVEPKVPQTLDEKCPNCGKNLRQVMGKFGPFIACSGYPDCTYIKQTIAKFPCPLDKGDVIRRSWKGKIFWGCKNYPQCTFSISGDIEDKPCPKCKKSPYMHKKTDKDGNITLTCPNKECGYTKTIENKE